MCSICVQVPMEFREQLDPIELLLVTVWAIRYACQEQNPGPIEEQQVLLTTEPSLQPKLYIYLCYISSFCKRFYLELIWRSLEMGSLKMCSLVDNRCAVSVFSNIVCLLLRYKLTEACRKWEFLKPVLSLTFKPLSLCFKGQSHFTTGRMIDSFSLNFTRTIKFSF